MISARKIMPERLIERPYLSISNEKLDSLIRSFEEMEYCSFYKNTYDILIAERAWRN